jgi:hypothetical protein
MSVIKTTIDNLIALRNADKKQYILKGLSKKRLGFIVSGPDVGKGYLCLSIAYELATDLNLLNLRGSQGTFKTLYWPIEDGVDEVAKRILSHMEAVPAEAAKQISENVQLWDSDNPLCSLRNGAEIPGTENGRQKLIEACKDVDLLIIDTLREAAGNADEVDDDQVIKKILQEIATKGDVAVLLVHHLTKAAIRGLEKISNVSGSGFSRTQANSRMHLYLENVQARAGVEPRTALSHIKANYIPKADRLVNCPLTWTPESLLCLSSLPSEPSHIPAGKAKRIDTVDIEEIDILLSSRNKIEEVEPKSVNISSIALSQSSIQKQEEQKKKDALVTDDDREKLKAWNAKRKRDQK